MMSGHAPPQPSPNRLIPSASRFVISCSSTEVRRRRRPREKHRTTKRPRQKGTRSTRVQREMTKTYNRHAENITSKGGHRLHFKCRSYAMSGRKKSPSKHLYPMLQLSRFEKNKEPFLTTEPQTEINISPIRPPPPGERKKKVHAHPSLSLFMQLARINKGR